ncbi:MAG: rRNA maturation RNase YbeY [Acidimicrobiales bacterium]
MPAEARMPVEVFVADEQDATAVAVEVWASLAREVLELEGVAGPAELSLLFVDEATIAELNSRFLGRSGPTDVLAFPIDEEPVELGRSPDSGGPGPGSGGSEDQDPPTLIGDVLVCPAQAGRNAAEHGVGLDDEIALLVVHGILHLLGMDHLEDVEAEEMESRERELLEAAWGSRAREGAAVDGGAVAGGRGESGTAGLPPGDAGLPPGDAHVHGPG